MFCFVRPLGRGRKTMGKVDEDEEEDNVQGFNSPRNVLASKKVNFLWCYLFNSTLVAIGLLLAHKLGIAC